MSGIIISQAMSLLEGMFLGILAGLSYDICRVLKARLKIPSLVHVLDLTFWLVLTFFIFLWSQTAWSGTIRLYGISSILFGCGLYFITFTSMFLWLCFHLADLLHFLLKLLYLPVTLLVLGEKKIKKIAKNLFLFWWKWYKIEDMTEGLNQAMYSKEKQEKGRDSHAPHTSRIPDKNSRRRDTNLSGRLPTHGSGRNTKYRSDA